jgi:hypothetical protein
MRARHLVWLALGLCACSALVREPAPAAPRARVRARAAAAPERTPVLRLPSVPDAGTAARDGVEFLLLPFGWSDVAGATDAPPPEAAEPTPRAAVRGVASAPRRSTRAAAVGAVAAGLAGGAASLAALRGLRRARRALRRRGA